MADKGRLINVYKLVIDLAKANKCGRLEHDDVLAVIASQDTVDAVEVVRCKDCNEYNGHRYCTYFACSVLDNDFCSYGERKNNG